MKKYFYSTTKKQIYLEISRIKYNFLFRQKIKNQMNCSILIIFSPQLIFNTQNQFFIIYYHVTFNNQFNTININLFSNYFFSLIQHLLAFHSFKYYYQIIYLKYDMTQSLSEPLEQLDQQVKKQYEEVENHAFTSSTTLNFIRSDGKLINDIFLMSTMISMNNDLFSEVIHKNQVLTQSVNSITSLVIPQEIQTFKKKQLRKKNSQIRLSKQSQFLKSVLFPQNDYKYSLNLTEPLPNQFYKDRNFSIYLNLQDHQGNHINNCNPIPISLCAYKSNTSPQIILQNKSHKPIFKGNCQSEIFKGIACFQKLQFREVTSAYPNHWVYFVIYPKSPSFKYSLKEDRKQIFIKYEEIEPLIISEVVVKSKKL